MLKIYALDYYRLSNAEHCALMDVIQLSLSDFPVVQEAFPKAVELFLEAVKGEHRALQHVDRPLQSARIHAADAKQVRCFRNLRDWAKLRLTDDDKAIVDAAKTIVTFSNAVGGSGIANQGAGERLTSLSIFIQRLEHDYYNEVVTLNLQPLLKKLKEANLRFIEANSERTYSDAEYGLKATKRARKKCDFTLKTIFSMIQDRLRIDEGEEFVKFVKFVNVEIDKYRISLGQGPGGRNPRRKKKERAEEAAIIIED